MYCGILSYACYAAVDCLCLVGCRVELLHLVAPPFTFYPLQKNFKSARAMPVVLLVGGAVEYEKQMEEHFQTQYKIVKYSGDYLNTRNCLFNATDEKSLFIVSNLDKPERYEIFCMAKKNEQQFISVARDASDGLTTSDKNPFVMDHFDPERLSKALESSRLKKSVATRRTRGVSLCNISEVKAAIERANREYFLSSSVPPCILKKSEERILRMWNPVAAEPLESLLSCYRRMVETECQARGITRTTGIDGNQTEE